MFAALAICFFLAAVDGVSLYQERQFAEAESEFRRVLAVQPQDARTRLYLARTLVQLGRVPEALAEIDRALATRTDPEIQFQAGSIVRDLAEHRFADLERLAPDSSAVRELAGRHYEQQGRLPEALREYRAAIAKEPGRPGLHFEAGNILWRMRELDAATQELKTELARTPHHGMANLRLGRSSLFAVSPPRRFRFSNGRSRPCPNPPMPGANWGRRTVRWAERPMRENSGRRSQRHSRMTARCIIFWGTSTDSWEM